MKKIYLISFLGMLSLQIFAQTYNGGTWYSLYDNSEHIDVVTHTDIAEYSVFAPASTLSFDFRRYKDLSTKKNIDVKESADGGKNWTTKGSQKVDATSYATNSSIALSTNINKLKFYSNGTGSCIKNVKVQLAQHILLADGTYGTSAYTDAFDFGSAKCFTTSSKVDEIALRSFLTAGNITITSSLPSVFRINSADNTNGLTLKVGANACASANGAEGQACADGVLGNINLYGFKIYFCPQEGKTYTGTITITDGTSKATIAVKGTGVKLDQTITFNAPVDPIFDTDTIAAATTSSQLAPTYSFAPEGIISFDGTQLVVATVNEATPVTITVNQSGDGIYNAAPQVEKTVTVYPTKTYGTVLATVCKGESFEFQSKYYGQGTYKNILLKSTKNCYGGDSLVTLTVNELPTYFFAETKSMYVGNDSTWHNIDLSIYSAGTHVLYDSLLTFAGCDSVYQLTLTVDKAPQTISWNSVLTSDTILLNIGDFIEQIASSDQGLELSYEIENESSSISVIDNTLYANAEDIVSVRPYQEGNDFYTPAEAAAKVFVIQGSTTSVPGVVAGEAVRKVLNNGQLRIVSGDHTYNAQGQLIR